MCVVSTVFVDKKVVSISGCTFMLVFGILSQEDRAKGKITPVTGWLVLPFPDSY